MWGIVRFGSGLLRAWFATAEVLGEDCQPLQNICLSQQLGDGENVGRDAESGGADAQGVDQLAGADFAFLGHGAHCAEPWREHYDSEDPHYWYYANIEDPNDRGYDAIRRLFFLEMAKVFAADCAAR